MVVADEPEVGGQAAEPLPARKGRRLGQEALESARALDEGVDLHRQGLEVIGDQGSLGRDGQDTVGLVQLMMDPVVLRSIPRS
jgi:hypothetical protein